MNNFYNSKVHIFFIINFKDNELVVEARHQFLFGLKKVYNGFISQSRITSDTFILLLSSVNMDLDDDFKVQNSWEYISNGLLKQDFLRVLFYLRNNFIFGKYATILMHNHLFHAFEVCIAYIEVKIRINTIVLNYNNYHSFLYYNY